MLHWFHLLGPGKKRARGVFVYNFLRSGGFSFLQTQGAAPPAAVPAPPPAPARKVPAKVVGEQWTMDPVLQDYHRFLQALAHLTKEMEETAMFFKMEIELNQKRRRLKGAKDS